MSYAGISIREALDKINSRDGWFLPQVQRQYVWGDRYESEEYVCLLLDSILKGHPIGGVVLWRTDNPIPYREFVQDYLPGKYARQVDKGRWGASKSLVYDGQQRLQTLYSVLHYSFNGRVLFFDLLFDSASAEADETGFLFRDKDAPDAQRYLRLTELVSKSGTQAEKVALEKSVLPLYKNDEALELTVRQNIGALWDTFVTSNMKSIAYFSVNSETEHEVNEVFRRLNTGGVSLKQEELVLAKIKAKRSDYEERLWDVSASIQKESGGIEFPSSSILQFFHLMIKNTIRIDEDRLLPSDIDQFEKILDETTPLTEVFTGYLSGLFGINNASIIPRWLAVLPIAAYLTMRMRHGFKHRIRDMPDDELKLINQYFLLSQLCDWNTQTMVNLFSKEAMAAGMEGSPFPLNKIKDIAGQKARNIELDEIKLEAHRLFVLKVLTPTRVYSFHGKTPQVDHIFPRNLDGASEEYKLEVDVLWNFQPLPADVNNYKRARHPKEFFQSADGKKYLDSYDYVPSIEDEAWDDYKIFIEKRRVKMLDVLSTRYGLGIANEIGGSVPKVL